MAKNADASKKGKKIKKETLAIIIAAVLIFSYVFYEFYSVSHTKLETQTAITTTVYESINATAYVIRDEHSLSNSSSGITVPTLADGNKINVGGNVAMTFSNNEDATNYSKYVQLQEKIDYYENLKAQTVGQAASVESIGNEINTDINAYIQQIYAGDCEGINDAGSVVNHALLRRQMIIGESVDLAGLIKGLKDEADGYSSSKPTGFIKTDISGVFSSYTDGYEGAYDYAEVQKLTASEIEKLIKNAEKPKETSDNMGKLITSYTWYLACVVDSNEVRDIENGDKLNISFKNNTDSVITVQVVDGADPQLSEEKTALIMKCNSLKNDLASLRVEDIEIRIKEHEGFKVPATALHVVDGKKGVYALISSQVRFREADVIYSNGDYLILSYDANNSNGIRLYDKIILQGKDLEDGRVYT